VKLRYHWNDSRWHKPASNFVNLLHLTSVPRVKSFIYFKVCAEHYRHSCQWKSSTSTLIATKRGDNQARIGLPVWDECLITIQKRRDSQARIDLWGECLITTKRGNYEARIDLWGECLIATNRGTNQARIGLWDGCLIATKRGITKLG
jgi:hypothetical protein